MAEKPEDSNSPGVTKVKSLACPVCDQSSDLTCRSCMKVNYCGREHQKSHWKAHKAECFPAVIEFNPRVGRHLVASRRIEQGEVIFREKPLVSGPLGNKFDPTTPVCLSCFHGISSAYSCSTCGWPVCGQKCEKNPQHAEFECAIFAGKRVPPPSLKRPDESGNNYLEKIIVLRGVLLKEKNPLIWGQIAQLEAHSQLRGNDLKSRLMLELTASFIMGACGQGQVSLKDIDQVLGSVVVNGFVSDDSLSSGALYRNGSYLFYLASMPAHNCTPNSSWVIQANSEFVLRASVPIDAGESITQLYAQPTEGTVERRLHLQQTKFFTCACPRCIDPTELGTYFSALKCPVCPQGYLLPVSPAPPTNGEDPPLPEGAEPPREELNEGGEDVQWKCDDRERCGRVLPETFVEDVLDRIQNNPQLLENQREESRSGYLKGVGIIEKLLRTHQGKTVHENHYTMHSLENDLLQRMSYILTSNYVQNENEKMDLAERMAEVARKCIRMSDVIWPGFNRHQGRLYYFLQQALLVPISRAAAGNNRRGGKGNNKPQRSLFPPEKLAQLEASFQEVLEIREKVYQILILEPEGREECIIASMMKNTRNSEEIQTIEQFFKARTNNGNQT